VDKWLPSTKEEVFENDMKVSEKIWGKNIDVDDFRLGINEKCLDLSALKSAEFQILKF
jgi:hypothetical protein